MGEKEQVKPLAPAAVRHHSSSDDEETVLKKPTSHRTKIIRWCSCMMVVMILVVVVVVTLIFTIFKIREPEIKLNGITVNNLGFINGAVIPGTNVSLTADISVKNPNFSSFRYKNTTTNIYYHGSVIGTARGPPGQSKARKTARMNITIDIIVGSLLRNPNLDNDLGSGLLTMSSYTTVGGRVKILTLVNKQVTLRMNCTMKVNITSRSIEDQKCKKKVKL